MHICSINNHIDYSNKIQHCQLGTQNLTNINFQHHPDFVELAKDYNITASNYFRRGAFWGSVNKDFIDVINSLKLFFNPSMNLCDKKINMLIGGIADSQEPYSILAVVKSLIEKNQIKDVLDLQIVDLQSKPDENTLFYQSFYDKIEKPAFVPESFVKEETERYGWMRKGRYKVKDDIFEFLKSTYENSQKAKWETRIQDAVTEYPDESLDIISVNNTIGYINDYTAGMDVLSNIYRALKHGGVFITDSDYKEFIKVFTPEVSDEIYKGIYRKK